MKYFVLVCMALIAVKKCSNAESMKFKALKVISINNVEIKNQELTLKLVDDKKITGYSGCNTFWAKYVLDNENISISEIVSSKKYCPMLDVSEKKVFKSLRNISRYEIKNTLVHFYDSFNTLLITAEITN